MTTSRKHTSGRPLLGLGLLILAVGSYFAERVDGGNWASWSHVLGGLLLVWYLRVFLHDHRAVVLTSFYQIYSSLGMLVSAAIISGGAYMIEVSHYGTSNGFFWVVIIYFVAGMEMTRIGYNLGGRIHLGMGAPRLSPSVAHLLLLLIVGATLIVAAYVFILTGGPLLSGVDRVTFWRTMAPAGTSLVPSLVTQSFFFAAFYFLWQRKSGGGMLLPTAVVICYILTALFVLGQKFSVFIIFLNTWLLLLPGILPDFRFKFKHLVMMAFVAVAVLLYVAATYILDGKDASFVITRAALQAQLLWSVFDEPGALSLLPQHPGCYFGCDLFASGQDYITYRYLPIVRYNHYAEVGTVLSGFMPALSILTLGMVTSISLHLTISFILGFAQRKMVASFANRNLIYGFLLFKAQFSITIMWFTSGSGPLRGLILTLALIAAYRFVLAKGVRDSGRTNGTPGWGARA